MNTKQTVKALKLFINKRNGLPILDNVHLTGEHITATDLEVSLMIPYQSQNVVVNNRDFCKILDTMPEAVLSLATGKAIFTQDAETIRLSTEDPTEFPKVTRDGKTSFARTISKEDIEKICIASQFADTDELRVALQHVYIGQHIAGTNGHILYFVKPFDKKGAPVLLKEKTIKLLDVFGGSWSVFDIIEDDSRWLQIANEEGVTIYQNVPEEKYANYPAVIPKKFETVLTMDRNALLNATKRAMEYSNKTTKQVRLGINGSVTVSAEDIDFGREYAKELQYTSKTGAELNIGFNGDYLVNVLGTLQSEQVTIKMNKPTQGALFNGCLLVMPVRLNG